MLDDIRERSRRLYTATKDKKYKIISDMLTNDNCFFDMSTDVAITILIDLGYTKEEAIKKYVLLTKKDKYVD